jgi:amidase
LWCRLIIPVNVAMFETFKRSGLDLLCDHRSDFPPEYLRWIEEGCQLQVPQLMGDEGSARRFRTRSRMCWTAMSSSSSAGLPASPHRDGRQHKRGPASVHGIDVDPLIGWFLT